MTYARQQEVFEEERGEVGPAAEAGLAVDREGLLANGALACLAQLGDFLVSQALELEEGDVALGGGQTPLVELPIDGDAESLEDILRLAAPSLRFGPRFDQLAIEPLRLRPCGCELPAVNRDAGEREHEDQHLEGLREERPALAIVDDGVDTHQKGDEREHPNRCRRPDHRDIMCQGPRRTPERSTTPT